MLLLAAVPAAFAGYATAPLQGVVVHVSSGARFSVRVAGNVLRVHLARVRVPARGTAPAAGARHALGTLLLDRTVTLLPLAPPEGRRVEADVLIGNHDLAATMVRKGWLRAQPGNPALRALERAARAAHRGMWRRGGNG